MYYYHLYGCVVKSEIKFPQLVEAQQTEGEAITICSGSMPEEILQKAENEIYYEFGDTFSWLVNDTCFFYVENGNRITYYLRPEGEEMRLRNYLLGFGMSMLFMQRGEMAIHCSALHNGKEAILIAGESGSGKSTLTNSYLAAGWQLMADDMVVAKYDKGKGTMVYPAFPYQKLCRNVAVERGYDLDELIYVNEQKDKFLVPCGGSFELDGKPLKKFLMLGVHKGEDLIVQDVQSIAKLQVCLNNLFLRHLLEEQKYAPKIGQKCLELIANVDVHLLARPKEKETTEAIKEAAFRIIL